MQPVSRPIVLLVLSVIMTSCADELDRTELAARAGEGPPRATAGDQEDPREGGGGSSPPISGRSGALAPGLPPAATAELEPPDAGGEYDPVGDAGAGDGPGVFPAPAGQGGAPAAPSAPTVVLPAPWSSIEEPASVAAGKCLTSTPALVFPDRDGAREIRALGCGQRNYGVVGAALVRGRKSVFARLDRGSAVRAYGLDAAGDPILGCVALDTTVAGNAAADDGGCEGAVGWMANLLNLIPDPPALPSAPIPPDATPPATGSAQPDAGGLPAPGVPPRPLPADPVCVPGALRCEGSLLARCRADGTQELELDCGQRSLCARALGSCELASCPSAALGCSLAELVPQQPGVQALAVGDHHACALLGGGKVRCWGENTWGQLGLGNSATVPSLGDDELPTAALDVEVGGPVAQLAAGGRHTCALLDSGEVRCWGAGLNGRLGYGNTRSVGDDEAPAAAGSVELGAPARQIVAGSAFTCALLAGGSVRCFGSGSNGQLGLLTSSIAQSIGDDETPASVSAIDLGGPAVSLAAGAGHVCALLRSGQLRCWGRASGGQLGHGDQRSIGDDESPASAGDVALGFLPVQISLGNAHSCALSAAGALRCWGNDSSGQLGYDDLATATTGAAPLATPLLQLKEPVVQVAAGAAHTCALFESGAVSCWGTNVRGQLGNASNLAWLPLSAATQQVELGGPALQIDTFGDFSCALLVSRDVLCWGDGAAGNLGHASRDNIGDDETPASVGPISVF